MGEGGRGRGEGGGGEEKKKLWVGIRGNLSHFRCLACWVVEFDYKCPFNTGW